MEYWIVYSGYSRKEDQGGLSTCYVDMEEDGKWESADSKTEDKNNENCKK